MRNLRSVPFQAMAACVLILNVACSFGPNLKGDLTAKVEKRVAEFPFVKMVDIKKYVKEQVQSGNKVYYFRINYEVINDCFVSYKAHKIYPLSALTNEAKSGYSYISMVNHRVTKGTKLFDNVVLIYTNGRLSECQFSTDPEDDKFGELE